MDKKLIQEYGEDILCYRILTARQKKKMQYEDFDKQLIKLYKEQVNLWDQRRYLGWELLIPPVQKGWKRFSVLREDVARSKQTAFFENVLKKINTCSYSHRRDFLVKKRKFRRKIYVVKGQQLLEPEWYHFNKLEFTNAEKPCFHEIWKNDYKKIPVKHYAFNEPWRFVLRVRPNMIDKTRKRDVVIEKRLHEIDSYLERNDYKKHQLKLMHGKYKYGWRDFDEKESEKYLLKNKSFVELLDISRY